MSRDHFLTLRLRGSEAGLASALALILDRALGLLDRALASDEGPDRQALGGKIAELRTAIADSTDPARILQLADACLAMCESAIEGGIDPQSDRRTELARLVALVRDTVAMLTGSGDTFSSGVAQAAERLDGLLLIADVQELKRRLTAEIGELQRMVAERQKHWSESVAMFEARVESLETQLVIVREQAAIDPLTGVSNRREFEQAFRNCLQATQRQFVVAVFDLDDFKRINDTGGHAAGDKVLRAVAQTLKASVRSTDIVARIGGDEFALLGHGATLREAEHRIRSLVTTLASIPTGLGEPAHVTVSCGLAECSAGDTMESLLQRADGALYEAKRRGKNRLAVRSVPFIRDLLKR